MTRQILGAELEVLGVERQIKEDIQLMLSEACNPEWPSLPIVLMSGKVVGRPGFPVIRKPFSQPQLAEIVGPIIRP